jgi:hypothetical protein
MPKQDATIPWKMLMAGSFTPLQRGLEVMGDKRVD